MLFDRSSQVLSMGKEERPIDSKYDSIRQLWHYLVLPPLVMKGKRIQHENALKKKRKRNNGRIDPREEEFHIDHRRETKEFLRRLFTEFMGMMILTTFLGADLLESRLGLITPETASFNNGLTILFLIYPLGEVSGAHFNPVVTLTFTMRRIFPLTWLPFYILSQFVGSIGGGLLIRALFGGQYASLGTNSVDTSTSTVANGFKWEIFLTFCLVFVILQTATKSAVLGSQAAIAVGAVLAITSLIGGSESSASMNPWRTLGPAIINNSPDNHHSLWIFIVGPIIGGVLAFCVVTVVQGFGRKTNELTSAYGAARTDDTDYLTRKHSINILQGIQITKQ